MSVIVGLAIIAMSNHNNRRQDSDFSFFHQFQSVFDNLLGNAARFPVTFISIIFLRVSYIKVLTISLRFSDSRNVVQSLC